MNQQKLSQLNAENRAAQFYFGYFAPRNRSFPRTSIQDVIDVARRQKQTVSPEEVEAFFAGLSDAQCGQWVGQDAPSEAQSGHFAWLHRAVVVARAARQNAPTQALAASVSHSDSLETVTHALRLRADWTLNLTLPADFTAEEAKRIAYFLQALPLEPQISVNSTQKEPSKPS